jgi:hypothetical protein
MAKPRAIVGARNVLRFVGDFAVAAGSTAECLRQYARTIEEMDPPCSKWLIEVAARVEERAADSIAQGLNRPGKARKEKA